MVDDEAFKKNLLLAALTSDTQPATQAVEALIHQYGRLVFQVIYGLTGDWHESQDLTQDTFVAAFKAIEAARQASGANFHAKAWLMQIAANNARMSLRRRRLVRFVPFTALRKEEQEEHDSELVGERPAPVQPAGYGMESAGQDRQTSSRSVTWLGGLWPGSPRRCGCA